MTFSFILLDNCTFLGNLPIALALCLLPFLLGWLAATAFHKVGWLKSRITELTADNNGLNTKVSGMTSDITDLRVRISQLEAELESKNEQIRKLKNDLIICESERNILQSKESTGPGARAAAAAATVLFAGTKYKTDDLKIVEGIGPKIAELLNNAGIMTWKALAETSVDTLKDILIGGGPSYQIHDPSTWAEQSRMADNGEWDALKKWQDELNAGKTT
jgi:predicted flap endonuclease-1-like 5' DNA nuclease